MRARPQASASSTFQRRARGRTSTIATLERMLTGSAARSLADQDTCDASMVTSVRALVAGGWTSDAIRAQVRAHRWQRIGRAVVRHNGQPTTPELRRAALIVLGPRAVLTAFTALEEWGLTGWQRDAVHVLVPRGARVVRPYGLPLRVHYTGTWQPLTMNAARHLHRPAPAAVVAAGTLANPRTACGVLAASVQQRLIKPGGLVVAVNESSRVRHRAVLLAAARDIEGGSQALSEIDFIRLCRVAGLPEPARQVVRLDRFGRRRYLDAEWLLARRRRVVVEVDGALHLIASFAEQDALRQNELVLTGDLVLRFPSTIVRCEPATVISQLRRALLS